MIRVTTIFLCVLLAAAFGRYRAEVSVRELRKDIERIETSQVEELRSIQMLRAEIAFLENPDRLAKVAAAKTDLRPSTADQVVDARQFAASFIAEDLLAPEDAPSSDGDVILHALAMAQLAAAE
ncbi:MAG: hypothetical protein AAFW68_04760 [Pseudomonadota bacterium]